MHPRFVPGSLLARSGDVMIGRDDAHTAGLFGAPVLFRNPQGGAGQWVSGFNPFTRFESDQEFFLGSTGGLVTTTDAPRYRDVEFGIHIQGSTWADLQARVRSVWRVAGFRADTTTPTELAFQMGSRKLFARARLVDLDVDTGVMAPNQQLRVDATARFRILSACWFDVTGTETAVNVNGTVWGWDPDDTFSGVDVWTSNWLGGDGDTDFSGYLGTTTAVTGGSLSDGPTFWTADISHDDATAGAALFNPVLADVRGHATEADRAISVGNPSNAAHLSAVPLYQGDILHFDSMDRQMWYFDASGDEWHHVNWLATANSSWIPVDDGQVHQFVCFAHGFDPTSGGTIATGGPVLADAGDVSCDVAVYTSRWML